MGLSENKEHDLPESADSKKHKGFADKNRRRICNRQKNKVLAKPES
jgi:hypothetical protein